MNNDESIDRRVLRQAAQLLVRLNSGHATPADHAASARWREQSDAHRHAWELAQQLTQQFSDLPPGLGNSVDKGAPVSSGRRHAIKALSWLVIAGPTAWLASRAPWRVWNATYRTGVGEQRDIRLADNSQLTLDTDTAVDVAFDATQRRVLLRTGEIMALPAVDRRMTQPALRVETAEGSLEGAYDARNPKFSVRQQAGFTRVTAFKGDVQVLPAAGAEFRLGEGRCCTFTPEGLSTQRPVGKDDDLWTRGLLYANDMRLENLAAELSRYRLGVLRCQAEIADLLVSGLYHLNDTDATLALLERAYPIRVHSFTPYLTIIEPRTGATDTSLPLVRWPAVSRDT
jgi:transmembrane sensor